MGLGYDIQVGLKGIEIGGEPHPRLHSLRLGKARLLVLEYRVRLDTIELHEPAGIYPRVVPGGAAILNLATLGFDDGRLGNRHPCILVLALGVLLVHGIVMVAVLLKVERRDDVVPLAHDGLSGPALIVRVLAIRLLLAFIGLLLLILGQVVVL